ncbi:MAG: DUF916 domain-containing protein [Bacteroidales bacterium]|nr:DUF916 domain-containing protein [Bacteroidales bacterium]
MKNLFLLLFLVFELLMYAQENSLNNSTQKTLDDTTFSDMGVSVSPSSMHLRITPGKSETKEIKVKNFTKKTYKFQVGFTDFLMNEQGKPIAPDKNKCDYCLSKYIGVSPQTFELKPGEEIKVKLNISIPDSEYAYHAMWTIVTIDQVVEREKLDIQPLPNRLAMGVIPSFGFGVYVYQNPPNVKTNKIEIKKFVFTQKEGKSYFEIDVKNIGDGITYCMSYISLTNLNTGEQKRVNVKKFTILPQFQRVFKIEVPGNLLPGKYTAVAVIDFGSDEEMVAAEATFEVK